MRFTGHHPYKKVVPHSDTFSKMTMPLGPQNVNMVRQIRQLAERNSDSVLFGRNGPFCGIFRVFDPTIRQNPAWRLYSGSPELG
jgi:hypothetical protein